MTPPDPVLNIVGEKVALGPLRRDLLPLYQRWINDFEVTRTLEIGWQPTTAEQEEDWYDRVSKQSQDPLFTIYERATLRPIGTTGLHHVDHRHRTAEFGILIGEKDCWNKGHGTETVRLMLNYAFTGLGLHNVMLRVYSTNPRAHRAYTRAGFREFGRRRQSHRFAGQPHDVIYMDCLATELQSSTPPQPLELGLEANRPLSDRARE